MIYPDSYSFTVYRGVLNKKRFEIFDSIWMSDYTDLKYGINKETVIKDIERLLGKPESSRNIQRAENDEGSDTIYSYIDSKSHSQYVYHLGIGFKKGKLNNINIIPWGDPH